MIEGNLTMEEESWGKSKEAFEKILANPETVLCMKNITGVNVGCGLLLKSFFDEFFLKHKKKSDIRSPKHPKVRTIFNYLNLSQYADVARKNFKDIDCWEIKSWETNDAKNTSFARMVIEEIIPKCKKGTRPVSPHPSNIASSVAEALLNSAEHAYTGKKKDAEFRKMYLGVGEYPGTSRLYFCIYDKGIGIAQSLKDNPEGWPVQDLVTSDSKMIEKATKGRSGAAKDKKEGRGKGLKEIIDLLASNEGRLDIFSERGFFSTYREDTGKDRKASLEGTMVAFSFPIDYI